MKQVFFWFKFSCIVVPCPLRPPSPVFSLHGSSLVLLLLSLAVLSLRSFPPKLAPCLISASNSAPLLSFTRFCHRRSSFLPPCLWGRQSSQSLAGGLCREKGSGSNKKLVEESPRTDTGPPEMMQQPLEIHRMRSNGHRWEGGMGSHA